LDDYTKVMECGYIILRTATTPLMEGKALVKTDCHRLLPEKHQVITSCDEATRLGRGPAELVTD
jgi:hypothetical protein